jgi:hypothetical protein
MTGDGHVRFCEGGRGRFPPATHRAEAGPPGSAADVDDLFVPKRAGIMLPMRGKDGWAWRARPGLEVRRFRRGLPLRAMAALVGMLAVALPGAASGAAGTPATTTTPSSTTTTAPSTTTTAPSTTTTTAPSTTTTTAPPQPNPTAPETIPQPPPVMTLHTMVQPQQNGPWGVQITNPTTNLAQFYAAPPPSSGGPSTWLQVVVLDSGTLQLVSNTTYGCTNTDCVANVRNAIGAINTGTQLVVVASQPSFTTYAGVADVGGGALGALGVPHAPSSWNPTPLLHAGSFSAVGVPTHSFTKGFST